MQEYPDFSDSGKSPAKIGSLMIGAILGAGIALLLAPAHGRDTRRKVGSTVKRFGQGAGQVFKRTRDQIDKVKHDARSAIDKGRQEYMRSKDQPGIRASQAPAI
jgi:gas vesicle protein